MRLGTIWRLPDEIVQVYWEPVEAIHNAEQLLEWHGTQLRSLLETLIPDYLPNNEPVGVFLSGGIDSSCITALAAKLHNHTLYTPTLSILGLSIPMNSNSLIYSCCHKA